MIVFKSPWLLLLLPIVLGLWFWQRLQERPSAVRFPSLDLVAAIGASWRQRLTILPPALRLIALILFVIALAGPRTVLEETEYSSEGIDLVLAIDASGSMAAEDFTLNGRRQNRLEVVKRVVEEFVDGRQSDRIGLIAFARRAYTVSPLTTDYDWLKKNLERVTLGLIEDGTAVGSAISSSLSRLRTSDSQSRVVILLTDGVNNAGRVDPLTAARAAKALGVKVYTIGAGTKGDAPFPVVDIWGRRRYQQVRIDIDEKTLTEIAEITGGQYFRATDTSSLKQIYDEIDRMEKTKIEQLHYREYVEFFWIPLGTGLALLALELLLANTILMRLP